MNSIADNTVMRSWTWRPLFWEPVVGTGERLLIGIVYGNEGAWGAARLIQNTVIDALYGKASDGALKTIDHGLRVFGAAAAGGKSLERLSAPMMGLHPGDSRTTEARSEGELFRIVALMFSSLANLDKLDELEQIDTPLPEDVNRRFSTEVRDIVINLRPDLTRYFNTSAILVDGGQRVRFGFCSPRAVVHFGVLYGQRPSASVRDARARLFELQRAKEMASLSRAALVNAISREDDATLGTKQRRLLAEARSELAREASTVGVEYLPVYTAREGADRVIELA